MRTFARACLAFTLLFALPAAWSEPCTTATSTCTDWVGVGNGRGADKPPAPFAAFRDAANCTTYDTWPYGYQARSGYSARYAPEQLTKQRVARPTTFMLGELDILPLYGFDSSCPAMAQGPTRLARGLAYVKHIGESYGAKHPAVVIPACGHNARCMLTDERALPLLFPAD